MNSRILLLLGVAVSGFAGEIVNRNAGMELGEIGRGVPGYVLEVNHAAIDAVRANPAKMFVLRTAAGGNPGQCLMIPGYKGMAGYQMELADLFLSRDGEVEISFDAKIGPDENGVMHKSAPFIIDFRLFPDTDRDSYYPMLKRFQFRPTTEWKRFSRRFKVKAYSYAYNIWVLPAGEPKEDTLNALYLDNFRLEYVDGRSSEPEEYSVIPDRVDPLYAPGDRVRFSIRARLNGTAPADAVLQIRRDYNGSEIARIPVRLAPGADGTFTGKAELPLKEFGSFSTALQIKGKTLRGLDSSFQVLHPVVSHPFGSFGWGIGVNDEEICPFGRTGSRGAEFYNLKFGSFEREYRLMKNAGAGMFRVWGKWRQIEPEEGKFRPEIMGLQMDMLKKYGFEPLFCLVGNFVVHGGQKTVDRYRSGNVRMSSLPMYLYQYYYQSSTKHMGSVLPPMEVYRRYLDVVWQNWGKQVRCWEMSNEPGVFGMPAKNYIDYLKYTNAYLKERNPGSLLIGNGVTGDFGMNVVKWCDQLNAADPGYVDHLDGIAFHPYACGLDYINGVRGLYGACVKNIQGTLAKPRPMWNTECYYLPTARKRQLPNAREYSRYTSNELLRHFLDGFYHGVKASPSPAVDSFFVRADRIVDQRSMTELAAALNALSFLLKDMDRLEPVDLGSLVRAGIFTDKSGTKALGFLYDLRPTGSGWTPGKSGAQVLDLYGNNVQAGPLPLQFEPYFITGTPQDVKRMLTGSTFKVDEPAELFGRRCGDSLFVEARNRTGVPGIVDSKIGDLPVRFSFELDPEYSTVELHGVKENPKNVRMVPQTPSYTLPASAKLTRGTPVSLSVEDGKLKLVLEVADPRLKAAEGANLWTGSAVEVFLDPAPFRNLSLNEVKPYQFVFAALPSSTGVRAVCTRNPKTAAIRSVARDAKGYRMEIMIPLSELPESPVYGIDIEIVRAGEKRKESLGGDPGNSYRRRLHYHLIRMPAGVLPPNGDFARVSYGDPANWVYPVRSGVTVKCAPEFGRTGNGLLIEVKKAQPEEGVIAGQTIRVKPGEYTRGSFQVLARFENVRTRKNGRGRNGVIFAVGYARGRTTLSIDKLKADLTGDSGWTLYQFDFKIPASSGYLRPVIGFGPETTGRLMIDSATLTLYGGK